MTEKAPLWHFWAGLACLLIQGKFIQASHKLLIFISTIPILPLLLLLIICTVLRAILWYFSRAFDCAPVLSNTSLSRFLSNTKHHFEISPSKTPRNSFLWNFSCYHDEMYGNLGFIFSIECFDALSSSLVTLGGLLGPPMSSCTSRWKPAPSSNVTTLYSTHIYKSASIHQVC